MNYVISIINPEALGALTEICEKLSLPLTVTLHGRGTAMQGPTRNASCSPWQTKKKPRSL